MKPSRKILGIRLRNFDSGISKEMNWVGAILDYLDEQAESQEPKALEESVAYKCGGYCGGLHGPECKVAKPQEEPKGRHLETPDESFPYSPSDTLTHPDQKETEPKKMECICNQFCRDWPISPMYTWERCKCPCHQKETEPKKQCWCGHTDGHVLNTTVPFIKSQE